MASVTRQVFGEISDQRLQTLQSAKNRQNVISSSFASPMKPITAPSTGKRQRATEIFEDVNSENFDPSILASPTKKSKTSSTLDFDFVKPSKFDLVPTPTRSVSLNATPSIPSTRKILTPSSIKSTPINKSRGSPKHNRISAISKRRASSSPFRRVDPPSFSQSSPSLPFSIDAALRGTISNYTPKTSPALTPVTAPAQPPVASTLEDSMPKGWFFEIHEDSPEQEAANLMEHSASVLDISSDDDVATKQRNEEQERGKENIPPLDFLLSQPRLHSPAEESADQTKLVEEPVKRPRLRKLIQDAMEEDRRPLGDLLASDFYPEGCDASSYVTVNAGIEKPSSLSKEVDFSCQSPKEEKVVQVAVKLPVDDENVAPLIEAVVEVASS